jgi:glucan phosphoethanolaminetransferase (alkaline phosphatase superfamily)
METYQTLGLIGGILGILLTIGLFMTMGFLMGTGDVFFNASQSLDQYSTPEQLQREREQREAENTQFDPFMAGLAFAFIFYIVVLVITFVIRTRTKLLGIVFIVLGVIAVAITNGWGIIPFALLLPAGIVALRYKPKSVQSAAA